MDKQKFRMMVRDLARVSAAKMTERDVQASKKAAHGYAHLVRVLDGLLDCMLNGLNDHLLPNLHEILDALDVLRRVRDAQQHESNLPPELQKILSEEFEVAYGKKFRKEGSV